jgi:predicted ATP-binding protein involved in virulence
MSDVIIITGPNGYGKTMLLGIIHSILNNDIKAISPLRFKYLKATLLNDTIIEISRGEESDRAVVKVFSLGGLLYENTLKNIESQNFNDVFKIKNSNARVRSLMKIKIDNDESLKIPQEIFDQYIGMYKSTFIKAQRISRNLTDEINIKKQANSLSHKIKSATQKSSAISQSLDSSLPFRLSEKIQSRSSSQRVTNAKDRLLGVESIKKNYISYDLIEKDKDGQSADSIGQNVLRDYSELWDLYVEDSLDKLKPYKKLYEKIDLFVSLLNEKAFSFKRVRISKEKGFYFTSDISLDEIPLDGLSSGEQNQVIVYYEMIFNSDRDSVILIDEPEISLHVAWQKEFLSSFKSIQKLNKPAKIIIATHSPHIIDSNWDITKDLYTLSKENSKDE